MTFITGLPYCKRAQLVEGGEGGAGVRRLVTQRPVQLGGVADRLVDRQEQVAGVDDQVVVARPPPTARPPARPADSGISATSASKSQPVPVRYSQPRPVGGASVRMVAKPMITNADGGQLGLDPHPLLGGTGAGQVREVLVLVDVAERGVGMS